MAANTLNNRSDGETIVEDFFNDIHQALNGDFVGRNSSGVPTANQNLGTGAIPWGTLRAGGLVIGGASVDVSQVAAPPYRVTAGATRSTSNQPAFLDPAGSGNGASVDVLATTTNLVFDVNGVAFTLTADITEGSLTTAPSTNNTAAIDDTDATDQEGSRTWGESDALDIGTFSDPGVVSKKSITIDAAGTEITSKIGDYAAFLKGSEIFLARIVSATELTDCKRGFMYDDSITPLNRETLLDNDTLTLLSLGWVFLDSDLATVDVTYTEPTYAFTAPSSPATGDYWFDMGNQLWKRYDGADFLTVTRTFIGWVALDDTDCIGARSVDFDNRFSDLMNLESARSTSEIVQANHQHGKVSVYGNEIDFVTTRPQWNITNDLADSVDMYDATEQADRTYYCYLTDEGEEVISDISPYRRWDLNGFYHPHNPWRAVACFYNDGSSDIQGVVRADILQNRLYAERRFNSASVTSNGEITDMRFENLVPGKTYLLTGKIIINKDGGDNSTTVLIANDITDVSANRIGSATAGESGGVTDLAAQVPLNILFTARNPDLTFHASSIGGTSAIDGADLITSTHAMLTEMPFRLYEEGGI